MMFAGVPFLLGAAAVAVGLAVLALGVLPWTNIDLDWLAGLGPALQEFAKPLFWAGILLTLAGPGMFIGGTLVGIGLGVLGLGLQSIMNSGVPFDQLGVLGEGLREFAGHMYATAGALILAGIPFIIGAILRSFG